MRKTLKNIFFLFGCLMLLFSCDEIEIDNTDKHYPIELSISGDGSGFVDLNWTKTDISSFESYIIIRSSQSDIEDLNKPDLNSFNVEIADIKNFDNHTFTDLPAVSSDSVFYKVFVDIGDRFLTSNTVRAFPRVVQLSFDDLLPPNFSPKKDLLFFVEQNFSGNKTWMVNYKTGQENFTTNIPNVSSNSYFLSVSKTEAQDFLFVFDLHNNNIGWYDLETFNGIRNFSFTSSPYSVDLSANEVVFASMNDFLGSVHIYTDISSSPINTLNQSPHTSVRKAACISPTENEFIEVAEGTIHFYKIDNSGNLLQYDVTNTNSIDIAKRIEISPDYQHFIPYITGLVYNKNLSVLGQIKPDDAVFFNDYAFSEDGKSLFAINRFDLYEFSFPELEKKRKIKTSYFLRDVFVDENTLILVARNTNLLTGASNMMYQTFDISK